jgi:hypothetical protein
MMQPKASNALHQPETEFHGELQVFSGPALSPDDPSLEPRVRKGRPTDQQKPSSTDQDDRPVQE